MKKILFAILIIFSSFLAFSQNILPQNGNVGIGTITPENGFILDVNGLGAIGTQNSPRLYLGTFNANSAIIQSRDHQTNQKLTFFASTYNFDIGNVGIGTGNPTSRKLKVLTSNHDNDVGTEVEIARTIGTNYGIIGKATGSGADANIGMFTSASGGTSNYGIRIYNVPNANNNYSIYSDSPAQSYFQGNVGIGTEFPAEKLAVNGKIRAREIKVENEHWPDYVFSKSYPLPSLQQTEQHIKEKGHLPGIPSAAEVKANGIDLGEMNAKLLQKIEELTLHLIEMKKDVEEYKEEINKLKFKIRGSNLKP